MSFPDRYAVLLDGEWVKKTLYKRLRSFPQSSDIVQTVTDIKNNSELAGLVLYRVFFYTADPLTAKAANPISKIETNFAATPQHNSNLSLINKLEHEPDFAVRRGQLVMQGWKIRQKSLRELSKGSRNKIEAEDLAPHIQQKGVDMCIGLDLATLAIKRLVSTVVILSGDSDFVPALKLARTEGLRVHLATLGEHVRPELRIHADRILS